MPFLIVESDLRASYQVFCNRLHRLHQDMAIMPTISPNTSNQNFEITILFNVVVSSENCIFEMEIPPSVFRARVTSYALGAYMVLMEGMLVKHF